MQPQLQPAIRPGFSPSSIAAAMLIRTQSGLTWVSSSSIKVVTMKPHSRR